MPPPRSTTRPHRRRLQQQADSARVSLLSSPTTARDRPRTCRPSTSSLTSHLAQSLLAVCLLQSRSATQTRWTSQESVKRKTLATLATSATSAARRALAPSPIATCSSSTRTCCSSSSAAATTIPVGIKTTPHCLASLWGATSQTLSRGMSTSLCRAKRAKQSRPTSTQCKSSPTVRQAMPTMRATSSSSMMQLTRCEMKIRLYMLIEIGLGQS